VRRLVEGPPVPAPAAPPHRRRIAAAATAGALAAGALSLDLLLAVHEITERLVAVLP
jgi:hypothetical protein